MWTFLLALACALLCRILFLIYGLLRSIYKTAVDYEISIYDVLVSEPTTEFKGVKISINFLLLLDIILAVLLLVFISWRLF